jgi:transposase
LNAPKSNLVYLDETGCDDNETYDYGYNMIGKRFYALKNAYRNKRISIIAALNQKRIIAPFVFEGYCNSKLFEIYVDKILVPELTPGQIVIMDNASFHKGKKVEHIINNAKCHLIYLPPYSPDFNPIEHYWSAIKQKFKTYLQFFSKDLFEAARFALQTGNH